jgi:hypothetical protein
MISSLARARVLGALLALGAFALGVLAGVRFSERDRPGVSITVTATDRMPRELERLNLSEAERGQIQAALRRGRDRVMHARDQIDSLMQTAVDSTDAEIRGILSEEQRASLDSARRVSGPSVERRRIIKHQ